MEDLKKPMRKIIGVYTEQINGNEYKALKDYGFEPLTIKYDNILYWELPKKFDVNERMVISIPYEKTKQLELTYNQTLIHLKENIIEYHFNIS